MLGPMLGGLCGAVVGFWIAGIVEDPPTPCARFLGCYADCRADGLVDSDSTEKADDRRCDRACWPYSDDGPELDLDAWDNKNGLHWMRLGTCVGRYR